MTNQTIPLPRPEDPCLECRVLVRILSRLPPDRNSRKRLSTHAAHVHVGG